MGKKKYSVIYSLGETCACANFLKLYKLRTFSGPFDWFGLADFKTRIDLIMNGFENFWEFENIVSIPRQDTSISHLGAYHDKGTDLVSVHDFPSPPLTEAVHKEVKEKFDRRIKRFYEICARSKKVLLVLYTIKPLIKDSGFWNALAGNKRMKSLYLEISDEELKEASEKLNEKFKNNIDLLLIEFDESKKNGELEEIKLSPSITRYKMRTFIFEERDLPENQADYANVRKILSQYKVVNAATFIRPILKILTGLIPVKSVRKNVRKKLLGQDE